MILYIVSIFIDNNIFGALKYSLRYYMIFIFLLEKSVNNKKEKNNKYSKEEERQREKERERECVCVCVARSRVGQVDE